MEDMIIENEIKNYIERSYGVKETQAIGIKFIVYILYKILLELKENKAETIEEERFSKTDKIEKVEIEPLNIKNDLQRQTELVHYENIMLCDKINEIIDKLNKGE